MPVSVRRIHRNADVLGLGDVHRDVGLLQQRVGRRPVLGETGDAEAGAHAQRPILDDARPRDLVQDLLRRQQRAVDVGQRKDNRELVAAEPRNRVRVAQRGAQTRRHALQHAVAGMMAQRVVDLLEAVQVQEQQRQRRAFTVRDACRLIEAVVQERAVRQVGQRVVIRQMREVLFDAPALTADVRLAQLAFDGRDQPCQAALHDVVVRAGPHRRDGDVLADGPRNENERQVGVVLAQQGERRRAAETRHRVVRDGDVPRSALQRSDQRIRRVDALADDVVAGARERAHHEGGIVRRIFDDEEAK